MVVGLVLMTMMLTLFANKTIRISGMLHRHMIIVTWATWVVLAAFSCIDTLVSILCGCCDTVVSENWKTILHRPVLAYGYVKSFWRNEQRRRLLQAASSGSFLPAECIDIIYALHFVNYNLHFTEIWHVLSSCRMLRKFLVRFSKWLQSVKKVL